MANLFKADVVESIAKKTGNTKVASEGFLDAFVETVLESLKKGNDVSLIGFGSFKVVATKAKTGRNPRTGKEIKIPAKTVPAFSAGKKFKTVVNGK